jgi:hypothetical protein
MKKARSLMADFWETYFNDFYIGRKNLVLTARYAKKLHAMLHSAQLKKVLSATPRYSPTRSVKSSQIIFCRLRAAQRGVATEVLKSRETVLLIWMPVRQHKLNINITVVMRLNADLRLRAKPNSAELQPRVEHSVRLSLKKCRCLRQ